MKRTVLILSLLVSGAAMAKLPAPVLTDEAKAMAAEAAAKTAHGNKVAAYQLCKSMDKAAANHFKYAAARGKSAQASANAPACTDPGPFVYTPAAATPAAAPAPAAPAAAPAKKG